MPHRSEATLLVLWRVIDEGRERLGEILWDELRIRLPHWRVLREVVLDRGHVTARIIARRLGCSDANVSPIVHRLVRAGCIERKHPERTRVGYALRETESGLQLCMAGQRRVREYADDLLRSLSEEKQEDLRSVFESRARP
jgi:DNA-binding MarR family transcriptional regulator